MPKLSKLIVSGKDGTKTAGFVTAEENKPPRQCSHCRHMLKGLCLHMEVTKDDELERVGRDRDETGYWRVEPTDCCDYFQNKTVKS